MDRTEESRCQLGMPIGGLLGGELFQPLGEIDRVVEFSPQWKRLGIKLARAVKISLAAPYFGQPIELDRFPALVAHLAVEGQGLLGIGSCLFDLALNEGRAPEVAQYRGDAAL